MCLIFVFRHEYEVLLCEGEEFNESHAIVYKAKSPPYFIGDIKPATPYSVAVRLVSEKGFKSALSEINNIRLVQSGNSILFFLITFSYSYTHSYSYTVQLIVFLHV